MAFLIETPAKVKTAKHDSPKVLQLSSLTRPKTRVKSHWVEREREFSRVLGKEILKVCIGGKKTKNYIVILEKIL